MSHAERKSRWEGCSVIPQMRILGCNIYCDEVCLCPSIISIKAHREERKKKALATLECPLSCKWSFKKEKDAAVKDLFVATLCCTWKLTITQFTLLLVY